jgi:Flp pilus assembly protein TadD
MDSVGKARAAALQTRQERWEKTVEVQHGRSLPGKREELRAVETVERGIQHQKNGEDDLAIACFTEAIRLNPECARAYRLRGQIHSRTGSWAKAERDLSKARRVEARQT